MNSHARRAGLATLLLPAMALAQIVDRVSTPLDPLQLGRQGNGDSLLWANGSPLSDDDRFLVFSSHADNLVPGDGSRNEEIYLRDLVNDTTQRLLPPPTDVTDGNSSWPSISGDGRWVTFSSRRRDLLPGIGSGRDQIYLHDRQDGSLTLLSRALDGGGGDEESSTGGLSRDGRRAVFVSLASNLVVADSNDAFDVFLHDLEDRSMTRITVDPDGNQVEGDSGFAQISGNGRYVCFDSNAGTLTATPISGQQIYLRDLEAGTTSLVSRTPTGLGGNGPSLGCAVADAGEVAFASSASDLVAGDSNGVRDVFVYLPGTATVQRVSVGVGGVQGDATSDNPSISSDGRRVGFVSASTTFPGPTVFGQREAYLHHRDSGETHRISLGASGDAPNGHSENARLSPSGQRMVLQSRASNLAVDINNREDVFIHRLDNGNTTLASLAASPLPSGGGGGGPSVSADGRLVVFGSSAAALLPGDAGEHQQILIYDRDSRQISLISGGPDGPANGTCFSPEISADGRWVAYLSRATNLVAGIDSNGFEDVFLHDRELGTTVRVSSNAAGNAASHGSADLSLSASGSHVAFVSQANDLLPGAPTSGFRVLVWRRDDQSFVRGDTTSDGTPGNSQSFAPRLSADGRYVAFASGASNLVPGDDNNRSDVFRKDLLTGVVALVSRTPDGAVGNQRSEERLAISADGRYVAFVSHASNLVADDNNGGPDMFLLDLDMLAMQRVTRDLAGPALVGPPSLSADGSQLAFASSAALVPEDSNGRTDVFVYRRDLDRLRRASIDRQYQQLDATSQHPALAADGDWLAFTITPPHRLQVPGRRAAPGVSDVVLAFSPFGPRVFGDGFEP
jgi:Tol biopolymer transport system component